MVKGLFKNQFFLAVLAFVVVMALLSVPTFLFFKKIRVVNEVYRETMRGMMAYADKNASCSGELFYKTGTPIQTIYAHLGRLYVSMEGGKLTSINLSNKEDVLNFDTDLFTSFYSFGSSLYATDYFNDNVSQVRISTDGEYSTKKSEARVGLPSALVIDDGHYFVSNYASGNITKIVGPIGSLFGTRLDLITGMEIKDRDIYAVRTKSSPSLVSLNMDNGEKKILDAKRDFSSIASASGSLLVSYKDGEKAKLGTIGGGGVTNERSLDCSYPLKITYWKGVIYYTSMIDGEGRIFTLPAEISR